MTAPTKTLIHGAEIPVLGLGTWPLKGAEAAATVRTGIEAGYRLFDTAENYGNEDGVGQGIRDSGIDRAEVFITTKFNKRWHSVDGVRQTFENSAQRLGVDYIDLLLVHWPNPDQDRYVEALRGLDKLLQEGRLRAIGTSNFKPAHLQRVIDEAGVVPDLNQIQLSPHTTRDTSRAFADRHGIVTESWAPLAKGSELLSEPAITTAAEQYGKTPAQIVLRWHFQLGLVTVPKSATPERIAQNIDIFDFELSDSQVAAISGLDRGEEAAKDSDAFGH